MFTLTLIAACEVQEGLMHLEWYQSDGSKNIVRHSLNQRKQLSVRKKYINSIMSYGVADGCRGEAWLIQRLG